MLKKFFKGTQVRHIKKVYFTYFASKPLYGFYIFEEYTWNENSYSHNVHLRNKLNNFYKGMFIWKRPNKGDLEKGKEKGFTNNHKLDAIPFLTSQLTFIKKPKPDNQDC